MCARTVSKKDASIATYFDVTEGSNRLDELMSVFVSAKRTQALLPAAMTVHLPAINVDGTLPPLALST
jgi:hypothetical protein